MIFKNEKLQVEFDSEKVSSYLRACALAINRVFDDKRFGKSLMVTSVLRNSFIQVGWCIQYNFRSDFHHCSGFALDFRSIGLTEEELEFVLKWTQFNLNKTCKLAHHVKGTAPHLHLCMVNGFVDKSKVWAVVKNASAQEYFTG